MGYHYPADTGGELTINCSLNDTVFSPGDTLVASLEVANTAGPIDVDVYVVIVMPDGAIVRFLGSSFAVGIFPWFAGASLPDGFAFGPEIIFQVPLPDGAASGNYLFAAALTKPGAMSYLAGPDTVAFAVR